MRDAAAIRGTRDQSDLRGGNTMATNLVRFDMGEGVDGDMSGGARWGVVSGSGVSPLAGDYATTAALIERGRDDRVTACAKAASLSLDKIRVLSPVTTPCRIY